MSEAPAPDPIAVNAIGYLMFNAPIGPTSRDLFITDVDKLRGTGARKSINSPGGEIDSAQAIVDYMMSGAMGVVDGDVPECAKLGHRGEAARRGELPRAFHDQRAA